MAKKQAIPTVPKEAQEELLRLIAVRDRANDNLAQFVKGLCAGMGLKGSYKLDISMMEFKPHENGKEA